MKYPSNVVATIFLFQKKNEYYQLRDFQEKLKNKKVNVNTDKRTENYISAYLPETKKMKATGYLKS